MSAFDPLPEDVEWFVVRLCPECRAQQEYGSATHTGDCPNLGKMFSTLEFPAVSYGDYKCREQEIAALREALERISRANHMPYRDFKSYALSIAREASALASERQP